ncbi:MAG: hypothetical protein CMA31_03130 [Euryarchaeota archaeon]|nr:hypothetical protein [Euryarchaeota archaeon]|tara:strand:+ start:2251 stop:2463 length:213 start_codon:yes stop_codon:yes gene_type:complete
MATYKGHHYIDLSGPDGNAFALIGHARSLARQIGLDGDLIMGQMMGGDYNHLLDTFDKYFGSVVELTNRP